jgi:hypothetical protein
LKNRIIIFCLLFFIPILNIFSEEKVLTVATYEVSPFIDQTTTGELSGYSISLLDSLKKYLKEKVEFKYILATLNFEVQF